MFSENLEDAHNQYDAHLPIPWSKTLSKLPQNPALLLAVKKKFLPHTISSFRKQTTPFSITPPTPTCDLINIYTLCLPQERGVPDVVILLIGTTRYYTAVIILRLTAANDVATVHRAVISTWDLIGEGEKGLKINL